MSEPPAPPQQKKAPLPTIFELLTLTPLYTLVDIDDSDSKYIHRLRRGDFQFDCYCVGCGRSAPFKGASAYPSLQEAAALEPGRFLLSANCQRHKHSYSFWLDLKSRFEPGKTEKFIEKIGQFPSIEDIVGSDLLPFKRLLSDSDFAELKRATGLASHGIGIGSFVYLRRIFERLIEKHRQEALDKGVDLSNWAKMRMDEKIAALRAVLPPALVKNAATYAILSKGLHELDDNTCRLYFPVVRAAILQILDQDLTADREAKAAKELEEAVAKIHRELKE